MCPCMCFASCPAGKQTVTLIPFWRLVQQVSNRARAPFPNRARLHLELDMEPAALFGVAWDRKVLFPTKAKNVRT